MNILEDTPSDSVQCQTVGDIERSLNGCKDVLNRDLRTRQFLHKDVSSGERSHIRLMTYSAGYEIIRTLNHEVVEPNFRTKFAESLRKQREIGLESFD